MLEPLADGLWTAAAPLKFFGLHLGTRMTVVRLTNGDVVLHSPVALVPELRRAVDAVGPVRHIICPNLYHHVYAGDAARAYPEALVYGPRGLAKKRPDVTFHRELPAEPHADWAGELVPHAIEGTMLRETLFIHPRTRTVISSDLVENFETSDHWPTRTYLKLGGIHGKIGWSRLFRVMYLQRRAARASLARLLEHPFDRVVVAHGRVIERDGHDIVRDAFHWL